MTEQKALPPGEGRLPPQDISAEQATLGSMFFGQQIALQGLAALAVDDFYRESHRQVFAAMKAVAAAGDSVDLITVTAALRQRALLEEAGGPEYLMALMNDTPTPQLVETYAAIVSDCSKLRKLIVFGASVQEKGMAHPEDAGALLAETVTGVLNLADGSKRLKVASMIQGWEEDAVRLHAAINQPYGVTAARSGMPALDRAIGGYSGMFLIVMMSDQKAGKTSFGIQTALSSALQFAERDEATRQRVLVIPLEEGRQSWIRLAACWMGRVDSELTLIGRCPEGEKDEINERIAEGHGQLRNLPITIADGIKTPEEAVAAIQVEQHRGDLGLIVVDYLQKLRAHGDEREALSATAEAFQSVSEETNTPLLLSSQSTWNAEKGMLQTYGSRGALFDASLVMSLRRDVDEKKRKKDTGKIKCECARSIREWGELSYRVDYPGGGRYYDIEREAEESIHATGQEDNGERGEPPQDW